MGEKHVVSFVLTFICSSRFVHYLGVSLCCHWYTYFIDILPFVLPVALLLATTLFYIPKFRVPQQLLSTEFPRSLHFRCVCLYIEHLVRWMLKKISTLDQLLICIVLLNVRKNAIWSNWVMVTFFLLPLLQIYSSNNVRKARSGGSWFQICLKLLMYFLWP
jgi:hypothetical protein